MLEKIQARVNHVQEKLEKAGFAPFEINSVVGKLKRGVAGWASYYNNTITFDTDYMSQHEEEMLAETVPHEVVHLYVRKYYPNAKQAHGPEFRRLMRYLGCKGSTYHQMKIAGDERKRKTKTRFIYATPTNKEVLLTTKQHERHQAGLIRGYQVYYAKGGETITYTGKKKTFK